MDSCTGSGKIAFFGFAFYAFEGDSSFKLFFNGIKRRPSHFHPKNQLFCSSEQPLSIPCLELRAPSSEGAITCGKLAYYIK